MFHVAQFRHAQYVRGDPGGNRQEPFLGDMDLFGPDPNHFLNRQQLSSALFELQFRQVGLEQFILRLGLR